MKFQNFDLFQKFNSSYFPEKIVDVDGDNLILQQAKLWVRELNHIYKDHIEIEMFPILNWEIRTDFFFRSKTVNDWVNQIGTDTKAKLIYIIENFEAYHLKWFDNQVQKIKLMDIESYDNCKDAFEAITLVVNNMAAHNKW